jgi:tRNA (guanine-N7-)-methyltransferase
MARQRHRKSFNPYRFRRAVQRPDWLANLDPTRPLEVDLGFGRGEFLLERARLQPDAQFIGVEIRDYLVDKMNQALALDPRPNVRVLLANVKEHLALLFGPGSLSRVYIHFPDPWNQRKKHHKRRMVDGQLVETLYALLQTSGEVHLMTDQEEVGREMLALFEGHGGFHNACGAGQFCAESTTGVQTREERYYLQRGDPIYRLRFVRLEREVAESLQV